MGATPEGMVIVFLLSVKMTLDARINSYVLVHFYITTLIDYSVFLEVARRGTTAPIALLNPPLMT